MNKIDRDALTLALETVRKDPFRQSQIEQQNGWTSAAMFAAYRLQTKNLHLKPWQIRPMDNK